MGLFLKAGALFVTGLTGLTDTNSVAIVMTIMLGLVIAYTIMGGMVSVVVTDYIQFVVLSFGMILICGISDFALGWSTIVDTVISVHGESGFIPVLEGSGFGPTYMADIGHAGLCCRECGGGPANVYVGLHWCSYSVYGTTVFGNLCPYIFF